jgi:hypothetical protein
VLEPIRQRNVKRQEYVEFFDRAVQQRYPFGERELKRIFEYRKMLGLGDEEYTSLEQPILRRSAQIETEKYVAARPQAVPTAPSRTPPKYPIDAVSLESEK